MKRGTVFWVDLRDGTPPEFGKKRPGVVISNTEQNSSLQTVVIVPLSSRAPEIWPLRVGIELAGRKVPSFAVIPGIRQVSKSRLLDVIGVLPEASLEALADAVFAYLQD